jgi:hypothetical protein
MAVTIDGSAGVTTNAGGSVNPSTNINGINYSCRAWVNFNGTGTVAIRGSGNVTSITDNGTGNYTVNFTTAMTDANYSLGLSYAFSPTVQSKDVFATVRAVNTMLAGSVQIISGDFSNAVLGDVAYIGVSIFR